MRLLQRRSQVKARRGPRVATLAAILLAACGDATDPDRGSGTLRVLMHTIGATLDADGYAYQVGSTSIALAVQDSQEIRDLPFGEVNLELGGLADNCRAFSPGPPSVTVTGDSIVSVSLVVSCDSALRNVILYEHWTDAGRPEVWMMRPDGTGKKRFLAEAADPVATPNGTEVVYNDWTTFRLSRIRADSTKRRPVTTSFPGAQYRPDLSPDGRAVVFEGYTGEPTTEIYRVNLDGTGLQQLTVGGPDFEPRWSPDGRFITFSRVRLGIGVQMFRMPAEGGDTVPLAEMGEACCARWSFDGARLLYSNGFTGQLWTMAPDGSDARPLDGDARYNGAYAEWSPDGSEILVERAVDEQTQIWLVPLDGTDPTPITEQGPNLLGRWLR
jgi:Tol biopolymer transport system component